MIALNKFELIYEGFTRAEAEQSIYSVLDSITKWWLTNLCFQLNFSNHILIKFVYLDKSWINWNLIQWKIYEYSKITRIEVIENSFNLQMCFKSSSLDTYFLSSFLLQHRLCVKTLLYFTGKGRDKSLVYTSKYKYKTQ